MTTAHVVLHAGFDPGARIMLVKSPANGRCAPKAARRSTPARPTTEAP
jgi:hypothetical protein